MEAAQQNISIIFGRFGSKPKPKFQVPSLYVLITVFNMTDQHFVDIQSCQGNQEHDTKALKVKLCYSTNKLNDVTLFDTIFC